MHLSTPVSFTLPNGLRVVVEQHPGPMASIGVLYLAGSCNDPSTSTGLAHLVEHLMFCGTPRVHSYDQVLEHAGGENNAYTTNDFTYYHAYLPAQNLETALFLEADRMHGLLWDAVSFQRQHAVVVEEFQEQCLNTPYGEAWGQLMALSYPSHPYGFSTLGNTLAHVQGLRLQDAKDFHKTHYCTARAVLSITSPLSCSQVEPLVQQWFASIPYSAPYPIPQPLALPRVRPVDSNIPTQLPLEALYRSYRVAGLIEPGYAAAVWLAEWLGGARSALLHQMLVEDASLLHSIHIELTETLRTGLLVIHAQVAAAGSLHTAEKALDQILQELAKYLDTEAVTRIQAQLAFQHLLDQLDITHRSEQAAIGCMLKDVSYMDRLQERVAALQLADIHKAIQEIFVQPVATLRYVHNACPN